MRGILVIMAVTMLWCGWQAVEPSISVGGQEPVAVVGYTVRPGDTLWSYAQSITPQGKNVSQTVDELMKLNNMSSADLIPGRRLMVPRV